MDDCKQKWTNLRNSYARHLRNQNKPSGSGAEHKSKWYLADVLSFLKDYVQHRKQKGNFEKETAEEERIQSATEDSQATEQSQVTENANVDVVQETTGKRLATSDFERHARPKKQLPSQQVVGPMIEFLKSNTHKNAVEHPLLSYVKGMLPDYDTLTSKRQRIFKQKIVSIMNVLMDEQEMEHSSAPSQIYTQLPDPNGEVSGTSGDGSMLRSPPDLSGSDTIYSDLSYFKL